MSVLTNTSHNNCFYYRSFQSLPKIRCCPTEFQKLKAQDEVQAEGRKSSPSGTGTGMGRAGSQDAQGLVAGLGRGS